MSGETSTPTAGRFSSQSNHFTNSNNSTNNKKYPGSPKSPSLNSSLNNNSGGNRNSHARQRLLTSKVSAPRPINLPSLRREHASGTVDVSSSPGSQHGWGSANSSPSAAQTDKEEQHTHEDANTSPTLISSQSTTRAWGIPSTNKTEAPIEDFPTAAEATKKADDKAYLKFATSDPNHTSWDEMVNEDLDDFSVDVIEFDDGTRVQVEADTDPNSPVLDTVSPSERFNDDYDRSYMNQHPRSNYNHYEHGDHHMNNGYRPYRRSMDHGYNSRYNNNNNPHFENRRFNSQEGERRPSNSDRWPRRESTDHYHPRRESAEHYNRRPSHDRKSESYHAPSLHPTQNQRSRRPSEQSTKSDHSREDTHDHNPLQIIPEPVVTEEVTVAQKNVMLTAAERAKRRLDEQEAEYKAAAERAKQKAAALAEKEKDRKKSVDNTESAKSEPTPTITKPWNLVAAKNDNTVHKSTAKPTPTKILTHANEHEDENKSPADKKSEQVSVDKKSPPATEKQVPAEKKTKEEENAPAEKEMSQYEDEWAAFVLRKRNNEETPQIEASVSSWHSYATRLQEKDGHKYNYTYTNPAAVEVHDYSQNEDWGKIPHNLAHGKGRTGWVRNEERNRGGQRNKGRTSDQWHDKKKDEPGMIEILKHEPKQEPKHELKQELKQELKHEAKHELKHEAKHELKHEPKQESKQETQKPAPTAPLSNKERVQLLLQESVSPLFPDFLAKLVIKKPSHLNFMVDSEDSDSEITTMDQVEKTPEMETNMVKSSSTISSVDISSPGKTNANFPVLMYEYPNEVEQEPKVDQQASGVYLMAPQHFLSGHQLMVPYVSMGMGRGQPVYYPSVSWQQEPHDDLYQQRRRFSFGKPRHPQDWNNREPPKSRGAYRKRGSWSTQPPRPTRGRGGGKPVSEENYF